MYIADANSTTQQYGPGSNYGYVCGGYSGDGNKASWYSIIDRFQFPFDSGTANKVGNLSRRRRGSSANNSSTYGYVYGGDSGYNDTTVSTIDRFQFPFDSGTANKVGNLSKRRSASAANNSSTYGYVCGGDYGYYNNYLFIIDRFQFSFDSGTTNQVGNLSGSRSDLSANNSSTYGYVCGGFRGGYQIVDVYSTIDRFQFPFDSGTANQVGNLSVSREWLSANNSSTHSYVCGGYNHYNGTLSTIDRFQFPFDSGTANHVGNLSRNNSCSSANNSSVYGYVCGGGSDDFSSTIDRFQFPFDSSITSYVGNLSGSRDALSAVDGVDFVTMFV